MSFIHCSPLFIPLMPLPMMKPEVMCDQRGKGTSSVTNPTAGTMAAPSKRAKRSPSGSAKDKGKQPATSSLRPSHPLSQPPLFAVHPHSSGSHFPLIAPHSTIPSEPERFAAQIPLSEHQHYVDSILSYPRETPDRPELSNSSSYQENSFDSEDQASLMFTVESQPMDDLSSSQQIE